MHTETPVVSTPSESSTPADPSHTDVPDWLKTSDHEEAPVESTPIPPAPLEAEEIPVPIAAPTISENTPHEDIPDWLK